MIQSGWFISEQFFPGINNIFWKISGVLKDFAHSKVSSMSWKGFAKSTVFQSLQS